MAPKPRNILFGAGLGVPDAIQRLVEGFRSNRQALLGPMGRNNSRLFFVIGCSLVLAALWPAVTLVNRIYPFILGLPFFVFYMLMLNFLSALFLFIVYRKTL